MLELTSQLPISRPLDVAEVAAAVCIIITRIRWADVNVHGRIRGGKKILEQPNFAELILLLYRRKLLGQRKARWGDKLLWQKNVPAREMPIYGKPRRRPTHRPYQLLAGRKSALALSLGTAGICWRPTTWR